MSQSPIRVEKSIIFFAVVIGVKIAFGTEGGKLLVNNSFETGVEI